MDRVAQTVTAQYDKRLLLAFPLSWSHYVRLMSVENPHARAFYEAEAVRGGWSVRQLDRQISTQFFERASQSEQRATMLARGQKCKPEDAVSVEDEIRDPYLLEFLNLKDEYSESDLEGHPGIAASGTSLDQRRSVFLRDRPVACFPRRPAAPSFRVFALSPFRDHLAAESRRVTTS